MSNDWDNNESIQGGYFNRGQGLNTGTVDNNDPKQTAGVTCYGLAVSDIYLTRVPKFGSREPICSIVQIMIEHTNQCSKVDGYSQN